MWKSGESERYLFLGKQGEGKTLTLVNGVFAWQNQKRFRGRPVFANLTIKVPNFHYFPYVFLPWSLASKLHDFMVCIDDPKNTEVLLRFISILASIARKNRISCIITAQRKTFVTPDVRELLTACGHVNFQPEFNEDNKIIDATIAGKMYYTSDNPDDYFYFTLENAISNVAGRYDTNEIVPMVTESKLLEYVKEVSANRTDFEINCYILWGKTETRRIMRTEI